MKLSFDIRGWAGPLGRMGRATAGPQCSPGYPSLSIVCAAFLITMAREAAAP